METSTSRNAWLIGRMAAPADDKLAQSSWAKTQEEIDKGIALGPFNHLHELPFATLAVVCRKGIWEKHGTATEFKVRNIDDFLVRGQNECSG